MNVTTRLGPLERAIQTRDSESVISTIRRRCTIVSSPAGICWIWQGAKRTDGYPYTGRARTNRLTHRVVAWANNGCVGAIADYPHVHHLCGITTCVNPEHLVPTTDLINNIERSTRNALLHRIEQLTEALREIEPRHALLAGVWGPTGAGPNLKIKLGATYQSPRLQLRRMSSRAAYDNSRSENQARRFKQVIEVDSLVARGHTKAAALAEIGIDRTAYYEWRSRMREVFGD